MSILFAVLLAAAVVLAISAGITATRHQIVALLRFAPAFGALAAACTLPGHRNVPGSAALLACCAALLLAAGVVYLRDKRAAAHG